MTINIKKLALIFTLLAMLLLNVGCGFIDPETLLGMEAAHHQIEARA